MPMAEALAIINKAKSGTLLLNTQKCVTCTCIIKILLGISFIMRL